MPKISIIVPVYNVEKYLDQCLKSMVHQTFSDIEIIIVDDGSPDNSSAIYQKYAEEDQRVQYIKKENGGVSRARNTGLEKATGDYVLFIDSDDWMTEDACEILYSEAIRTDADFVIADTYMTFEDGKTDYIHVFKESYTTDDRTVIKEYQKTIIAYPYNPMPYGDRCMMPTGLGGPWNKLVKRKLIIDNHIQFDPYVNGMFDDCLYSLHVLEYASKITYIAKPVYYYRMVSTSLLHKYRKNMLETNAHIFERIRDFIQLNGDADYFKSAYDFYVCRRLMESLGSYFFADSNQMNLMQRINNLSKISEEEPYSSALKDVDADKLKKSWKMICKYLAQRKYYSAWFVYKLKDLKNMISGNR